MEDLPAKLDHLATRLCLCVRCVPNGLSVPCFAPSYRTAAIEAAIVTIKYLISMTHDDDDTTYYWLNHHLDYLEEVK